MYRRAIELYKHDGKWQEALVYLHVGVQHRRSKQDTIILEKLMTLMIDVCAENLSTAYLKEDIGYFRNLCQHQSMNLLEKVLTYLRTKSEKEFERLERDVAEDQLRRFLSDDQPVGEEKQVEFEQAIGSPDELIHLAYTQMETLEQKNKILPRSSFYLDICKNILDTLRSNAKLLEFYNETVRRVFAFCKKYNAKREFRRISETLHNHFNQIVKHDKMLEGQPVQAYSKIPHPIRLDNEQTVTQLLKIRKEQLVLALHLEEWSDAQHTANNIYALMRKYSRGKSEQDMLQLQADFYEQLAYIFWQSKLYLFHTYAL